MLIDIKRKVAFSLIPKNASSSIRNTLMRFDGKNIFCNQDAHSGLGEYSQTWLKQFDTVAVIRDPVDRQLSWWRYENQILGTNRQLLTKLPSQCSYLKHDARMSYLLDFGRLEDDWKQMMRLYEYPALRMLNATNKTLVSREQEEELSWWVAKNYPEDVDLYNNLPRFK